MKTQRTSVELWLALKLVPRLAIDKKIKLVDTFGINKLFSSSIALSSVKLTENQRHAIQSPDWSRIAVILEQAEKAHCRIITFEDIDYPQRLKEIHDPPLVLFIQGNHKLLNQPQIAIVGSRSATASGRDIAKKFANELVSYGVVVTSGLAIGIDTNAHAGALYGQGKTIAVVATGLDICYPARNRELAKNIINQKGLIVSEFAPHTPPKASNFPRRNRIISGMSLGVLVVEAAMKSGSLITARTAVEQNRDVFAIPGSIYNDSAKGCHWLIKQGAKLVEDCADILEELESSLPSGLHLIEVNDKKENKTVKNEKQGLFLDSLLASVGYEITPVDVVVSRSKLSTSEVLTQLTMLELKGLVSSVPGGYLRLK